MSKLQGLSVLYFAAQKFYLFIFKFFVVFWIAKITAISHLSWICLYNTIALFVLLNKIFPKYFKLDTNLFFLLLFFKSMSLLCQKKVKQIYWLTNLEFGIKEYQSQNLPWEMLRIYQLAEKEITFIYYNIIKQVDILLKWNLKDQKHRFLVLPEMLQLNKLLEKGNSSETANL